MPSEITYKDIVLYKTECCRNWEEKGHCRYGKRCRYAHGREELRPILRSNQYKTKICKAYHDNGSCSYGIRCTFIHQVNATDRNHYNLIPPISPTSTDASFQPYQHNNHQMNARCQQSYQHNDPDLNTNMFISKNIMEDIIGLSSYEPTGH
ncbi:hypothetical protein MBANPS3_009949 [Mucor bainieri]